MRMLHLLVASGGAETRPAHARDPLCLGQSWTCGGRSAGVRGTEHIVSCVLSKCRPLPPSPVPGPAWAQTAAGGAGGAGKGSWRGAGAAVHPGERHFMVCLLGMTSPQRPSRCDGSDTLSSAASSPSRLILLGGRIPSTGTLVGLNPTRL